MLRSLPRMECLVAQVASPVSNFLLEMGSLWKPWLVASLVQKMALMLVIKCLHNLVSFMKVCAMLMKSSR